MIYILGCFCVFFVVKLLYYFIFLLIGYMGINRFIVLLVCLMFCLLVLEENRKGY